MIAKLFNNTTMMEKALDASVLRNEAIANNLANVDTPGYKRQVVEFENFLAEALSKRKMQGYTTHSKHIPIGRQNLKDVPIKMSRDTSENIMRVDGNNVDVDAEMALLSKNNIYYIAVIQQLSRKLGSVKNVINQTK